MLHRDRHSTILDGPCNVAVSKYGDAFSISGPDNDSVDDGLVDMADGRVAFCLFGGNTLMGVVTREGDCWRGAEATSALRRHTNA